MGKLKSVLFFCVGGALMLSMLPNLLLREFPAILPFIVALGAVIICLPVLNGLFRRILGRRLYKAAAWAGYALTAVCVVAMAVLACVMVRSAYDTAIPEDADVVVPGCAILGDQPRAMLKNRLDKAAVYLQGHPGARCVVTGGYFGTYTQAQVMRDYLVEKKGIESSRIFVDDTSNTTYENLKNAKELLAGQTRVAIATDVYHQFRAKKYARQLGLEPYALASATPANHMVDAWLREFIGIAKAYALGS